MKERPIIFSSKMVKAIREGRKTQTRRPLSKQPHGLGSWVKQLSIWLFPHIAPHIKIKCPFGQVGDRLWVRETWIAGVSLRDDKTVECAAVPDIKCNKLVMKKGYEDTENWARLWKVKPSIHMPRWASRITLEITDIRVERLQEISEIDIKEEGVDVRCDKSYTLFPDLWDSIYSKKYPWSSNPWVWVVEFKKLQLKK